jgi:ribosome-associated toxin RatA of RatAB toxin-antitoxin module
VYSVVVDVEEYPQFVPFCTGCAILEQVELTEEEAEWLLAFPEGALLFASTSIGFKAFSETYLSRIKCTPNLKIEVSPSTMCVALSYINVCVGVFK